MVRRGAERREPPRPATPLRPDGTESLWSHTHLSGNLWQLTLRSPVPGTGSPIVASYVFPFYHKIFYVQFCHTTSAGVESSAPYSVDFRMVSGKLSYKLFKVDGASYPVQVLSYMRGPLTAPGGTVYECTTAAPSAHLVGIQVTVEVLKN